MILLVRTDSPEATVGLATNDGSHIDLHEWLADRKLAKDLLTVIRDRLHVAKIDWKDLSGVVVYEGPGSFTGLRIGITVANTIAYAQDIPIVASKGSEWIPTGLNRLLKGDNDRLVLPHYGAEANITLPKK